MTAQSRAGATLNSNQIDKLGELIEMERNARHGSLGLDLAYRGLDYHDRSGFDGHAIPATCSVRRTQ
jgi:hypothetical protein